MKKFLIKWLLLSVTFLSFLFMLDYFITEGLRSSNHEYYIDWNTILAGGMEYDMAILGASRAMVQVSPSILDSTLNVKSCNLALNAYDFWGQYMRYKVFLKHNKTPKVLLQILGYNSLRKDEGLFRKMQFLPYLDEPLIRELANDYTTISHWDYHLPFVRYFGSYNAMEIGLKTYFTSIDETPPLYDRGYIPRERAWDNSYERFVANYEKTGKKLLAERDSSRWYYLNQLLKETQHSGTKVVLIYTPTYRPSQQYIEHLAELLEALQTLAQRYPHADFIDYSDFHINNDQQFFYNSQHLNAKGAPIFSEQLARDLKERLSETHHQ